MLSNCQGYEDFTNESCPGSLKLFTGQSSKRATSRGVGTGGDKGALAPPLFRVEALIFSLSFISIEVDRERERIV